MSSGRSIAVVGAGSFGTALAKHLVELGHDVALWARSPDLAAELTSTRFNQPYLPGVRLPDRLAASADLEATVAGRGLVLLVTPAQAVRRIATRAARVLEPGALVVCASKGIEVESLCTLDDVLDAALAQARAPRPCFLSGPSFARELAAGAPTVVVLAARAPDDAREAQAAFSGASFRAYTSTDVRGVLVSGALKNVIALAAGAVDGLGLGHNARAALVTRGLHEIGRLALHLGGDPRSVAGLAGMGDLLLTCTGELSRNRRVGLELGHGRTLAEILAGSRAVAEGVETTRAAHRLARREGVEMPITEQIHRVLFEDRPVAEAVAELMARELKDELG